MRSGPTQAQLERALCAQMDVGTVTTLVHALRRACALISCQIIACNARKVPNGRYDLFVALGDINLC